MNPRESAALSDNVYMDPLPPVSSDITVGGTKYEVLACRDSGSGYQGVVYLNINTKEVIVAHRGTEFDRQPMLDGGIDAAMVTARVNAQLSDALALTKQALRLADERGSGPVHVTGHSLGGALAQITAHHYNLPGDAFNPYGAAGLAYRLPEGQPANAAPFTNHVMAGDLVSAGGPHYGKVEMYALPRELEVLRNAEHGQRIASLGTPGMKSGHVMSAAVAVQLGDSHRLVHFLDRVTDKGPVQSVLDNPQARITDPDDLRRIADYRRDVHQLRAGTTVLVGGGPGLDHVVLGTPPSDGSGPRMFVVQGAPENSAHLRASVPISEAINTTVEQSLAKAEQIAQAQQVGQQDHAQEQTRTAMRMG
ncbi:hypothetical protein JY440_17700 [Stenotrophomonas maltophilia]|uniref:X-Tfes XVIPCD domain-containing protein n=1 Tax=Stenotrophomonas maltophilia TaxID=40324 RepID=A0AB34TEL2_STEMA|nr:MULTISPECIES: XVIPCD domain-containing protein [Stenotrophomonas]KOO76302.1 hypothetical protein VL23_17265 [Stenotrophomonas maltophilia]MBH1543861.1 hypothetical protein [Stenotrophomonas maltophilia]MBN4984993.1 hypothetical protein [Stenotrophomonas maltophilia]MDZ7474194.1 DUF6696 domain-containing protein [Stenotrophomonas pavanii]